MMRQKVKCTTRFYCITGFLVLVLMGNAYGQETQEMQVEYAEENASCFECHGKDYYTYDNEFSGEKERKVMCEVYQIDSAEFYHSNHNTFSCFDCHAPEFESYPHPPEAKMEFTWSCMDCHAYDEEYAEYHFEEIQEEYQKSVHAKRLGNNFSCWDCHDPHTYKTYARESDDILKVVAYDNEICLSCHGNEDKFYVYSDDPAATRLIENHDWLPKQEAHFQKVRCIECHTQTHDTLLVAHNILPKEKAVRKCVECHTRDSKLMASLYRHKIPESRGKYGFLNPKLAKDYYVIGANRNVFLNYASLIIFGLVVLGVLVHIILRIIYKQ